MYIFVELDRGLNLKHQEGTLDLLYQACLPENLPTGRIRIHVVLFFAYMYLIKI